MLDEVGEDSLQAAREAVFAWRDPASVHGGVATRERRHILVTSLGELAAITKLVAKYQIVTPLMVGGANHAAEFRIATYANMVRWWWRFLALGRLEDAAKASFWEAVLFGWPAEPFGQKQARFTLEAQTEGMPENWPLEPGDWEAWSGVQYLTAQGLKEGRRPDQTRSFTVEVRLTEPETAPFERFRDKQPRGDAGRTFLEARLNDWWNEWVTARDAFVDAMALIGLVGGLGARSRRGFGSLAIESLTGDQRVAAERPKVGIPPNVAAYKAMISACLGAVRFAGEPPYSALSDKTRIHICATHPGSSLDLMNEIGWAFQIYRSWGQRIDRNDPGQGHRHVFKRGAGRGLELSAGGAKLGWYNPTFAVDHDGFYQHHPGAFPPGEFDNRSVFGLPHNYGNAQIGWSDGECDPGRRASPLLMHFHPLAGGGNAAVVMTVPSVFAPPNSRLEVRPNGGPARPKNQRAFPAATNWALIEGFVDFVVATPAGADRPGATGVIHTTYTPVPMATGQVP